MSALNTKLLRDLWHLRSQALAIGLVIGCGVAMVVLSLGMVRSLDETQRTYYERHRFADVFAQVKRAPESLVARIAEIPGVAQVQTRIVAAVTLDVPEMSEPAVGRLISIPERGEPVLNVLYLRRGRMPEPGRVDEVMIGEGFADAHGLEPGDSLHAVINGHRRRLVIAGVALSPEYIYSIAPGALMPDDRRFGVLWMSRRALEAALDLDGAFNDIALKLMPSADEVEVIARLDDLIRVYGGLGAFARAIQISHWFVSNEIKQLKAMIYVIPTIFLAVSAFLLNVVLTRIVALEREQIGTLKAIGYSNAAVAAHYLKLALLIAALGLVMGTGAGIWLGRGMAAMYADFFRFPFLQYVLTPDIIALSAVVSVVAAAAGAVRAIGVVMRLKPAEAMRPEAPARYRQAMVERLPLLRHMGQGSRMILRHLERRPVRSAFSSLGIALALAILIAASFSIDAIDHLLYLQFDVSQREDVAVTLAEPRSRRAHFDFRQLPGVIDSESFRAVPARLRFRHSERRVSLLGLESDARLHRPIDEHQKPVAIPREGLVLSAKLAALLGAAAGDKLTVEVLEGRRPVREVVISGLVQDYVGTSAFMDIRALNRLMLEGPTISGAFLQVDSAEADRLYRQLKATPWASSLTLREAALNSFRETMAENILIMTFINIIFAGLIAFGVIYNSARIALSERGRELASLRVLGFSRGEISYILLGELAVLVIVAVPLGCLLGFALSWLIVLGLDTELYRIPLVIDRSTYGFSTIVVLAAAMVSALLVRARLDRLDLIAVLKTRV